MVITEMRKRMEAEKSKKKLFTKKRILILGIAVVILITAGGVAGYLFMRSRQADRPMQSMPQMNAMGENVISASGKDVLSLFGRLHEMGHTIVMITHDMNVAKSAERIVHIIDGRLE